MVLYIVCNVFNGFFGFMIVNYELYDDKIFLGLDDCIINIIFIGESDLFRDIVIKILVYEKDNMCEV